MTDLCNGNCPCDTYGNRTANGYTSPPIKSNGHIAYRRGYYASRSWFSGYPASTYARCGTSAISGGFCRLRRRSPAFRHGRNGSLFSRSATPFAGGVGA